MFSEAILFNTK